MTEFRNKATGLIKERSVKLATPIGQSFLRPPGEGEPGLTITARMEYAETADMDDVLAKSAELIAHTRANEPRTQSYLWAVEEGNPRTILVFEEFETPEFCFDTHMKTEPFIAATSAETEGLVATPTFSGRRFGFVRGWMG
jgi:quinol monooxygenase YgiN